MEASELYHERQEGNLCRMHALNHYVQRRALDAVTFRALLGDFSRERPHLPDPLNTDGVDASQEYVTTYGVERLTERRCTTFSVPVFGHEEAVAMLNCDALEDLVDEAEGAFFVYTAEHIWTARRLGGNGWATLDSLHGMPRVYADLGRLVRRVAANDRQGMLMVWSRDKVSWALARLRCHLRTILGKRRPVAYVREEVLFNKSLVGPLEVPLALFCRYHNFLTGNALGKEFFTRFQESPGDQENLLLRLTPLLSTVVA